MLGVGQRFIVEHILPEQSAAAMDMSCLQAAFRASLAGCRKRSGFSSNSAHSSNSLLVNAVPAAAADHAHHGAPSKSRASYWCSSGAGWSRPVVDADGRVLDRRRVLQIVDVEEHYTADAQQLRRYLYKMTKGKIETRGCRKTAKKTAIQRALDMRLYAAHHRRRHRLIVRDRVYCL